MIRESLTPGSPHAFMLVTPAGGNGLAFQRRVAAGGGTTHTSGGTGAAPVWVRVTRSGHTVSAFRSSDGMGWTMVGSETMALSATVYVGLALTSHSATLGTATFEHVAVTGAAASPSSGLPAGWTNRDVGAAGVAGRVTVSGGTWVMEASGADVWGSADAFHYAYRSLTGDGTIVARVTALQRTHMWAKAGVMIRAGLDPGAAHAFMLVTPEAGAGLAFQRRLAAGGATTHTSGGGGTAPVWVRLSRTGSTVTAWHSPDGATWTEVGRDTVALGTTVYVGVGATSHDNGVTASATFDNILVTEGDSAGWDSRDVGSVGAAGAAAFDGRAGTVSGSGADIWGGRDAFRYAYASARGDFAIVARVVAVDDVDLWTKAGVMIRASLSSDSPHVSLFATPTAIKGVAFQRRLTAGGASVHTPGASIEPTVWLRLWRQGGAVYAAYRRSSGDAWTTIAAESGAALPDMVFVGLAVTSHDDGAIATATFDNVAIGPVP
jgi:regulation of enolase protein 1 (concanavalin A-like superfamily)